MFSYANKTSGRAGRGEGGIDHEEDGHDSAVPAARRRPLLGVFQVAGSKVEVAIFVQIRLDVGVDALGPIRFGDGTRKDTFEGAHRRCRGEENGLKRGGTRKRKSWE